MSEPTNLREQLFPDGCPDAETFIRVLAEYIRETMLYRDDSNVSSDAEVVN